ncbi:MAG: flagellar filament capping protein FliD [Micrococcales bacterium]|nr:flagellar filament capping protein FliD [Micrococcales bacterium]MCL2666932.1 flagellar filament capping protein FliD [Micrococcales bacterium]
MAQISGLVSGLDTSSIINSLMNVEKLPQLQLGDKKTSLTKMVTALQALNTKVASLAENAAKAAKPASWEALTATSSAASVSAAVGATASATSVTFSVDKVASSQVSLTQSFTEIAELTGGALPLTLRMGDNVTEIDLTDVENVADLAAAINRSGAGVSASVVSTPDGEGGTSYRLQLTGKSTGADQAFSLHAGDSEVSLTTARAASDAQITLWPGTAASQTVTSSSNTFADLLTGLNVTVSKVEEDPVTLDVRRDTAALAKLGSNLVAQLNQALGEIKTQTASTSTTDSRGNPIVSPGVLSSNSGVRRLSQDLVQAGSLDIDGRSPSEIGITINSDGTFTFDEKKFTEALAADPQRVQSMLTAIAERVDKVATAASDKVTGTLTQQITSNDKQITDLAARISSWDSVLTLRREALERQWANLETALSKLNSQSSWLASITASLAASTKS